LNKHFASTSVKAVDWQDDKLVLLDQRRLPHKEEYIVCESLEEVFDAIKSMVVRGAPAIGICAAYGVVVSAKSYDLVTDRLIERIFEDIDYLRTARPTAVNLMWALDEMKQTIIEQENVDLCLDKLLTKAKQIHQEDIDNNYKMGALACDIFAQSTTKPFSVMTHCNAGGLATGGYGTALGVIRSAWQHGFINTVFADETRPWLQGARLTAWELSKDNIPVVLNVDCAASWVMKNKGVDWIIVGADRIAANGDVVNKIGTYSLAIQAKYHGAKVMVVAPSSTVDMNSNNGDVIEIEMRDIDEIRQVSGVPISSPDVDGINPVFDVTPASLIDVIVTEKGAIENPDAEKMKAVFK
jgi:methylthioribose-1-phosphate isomerase